MFKKILLLLSLFIIPALADTQAEIDHLLNYVKKTECHYIRNGSVHSGTKAAKHIKAKYEHYKDEIGTAEDFIRLSATKSLVSGSKYYIECPNSPKIESSVWLLEELKRFRNKK